MKILRVLLVCALFAGCGGDDEEQTATPAKTETPAAEKTETPAAQDEEAAVREVFDTYMAALKEKDFDTACSQLAPETTEKLQENVKKLGVSDPPETCPGNLELLQETAERDEGKRARRCSKSSTTPRRSTASRSAARTRRPSTGTRPSRARKHRSLSPRARSTGSGSWSM